MATVNQTLRQNKTKLVEKNLFIYFKYKNKNEYISN